MLREKANVWIITKLNYWVTQCVHSLQMMCVGKLVPRVEQGEKGCPPFHHCPSGHQVAFRQGLHAGLVECGLQERGTNPMRAEERLALEMSNWLLLLLEAAGPTLLDPRCPFTWHHEQQQQITEQQNQLQVPL